MEKVYSFTNENVSSYSDIYNMNGANMLTLYDHVQLNL